MRPPLADSWTGLGQSSLWLLGARVSTLALALLFVSVAARTMGPEAFGQFTSIAAVVLIGNAFTTFGTDTLLIRETAQQGRITSLVARAFTLQVVLSFLWCMTTLLLGGDVTLAVYSIILFPLAVSSILSSVLRAFERMDLFWVLSLFNGAGQVAAAFFASDVMSLVAALLAAQAVSALLGLYLLRTVVPDFHVYRFMDFRPLLKVVLPFAALATLTVLLQRIGVLSTFVLAGDLATGLYSSAARVVEGLKFGHYAVLGALLPAISRGAFHSSHSTRSLFGFLLGLSLLLAAVSTLAAGPVILLLFGDLYRQAVGLLAIMVWGLLPYTVSASVAVQLVARGFEHALVKATLLSFIMAAVLYYGLITAHGLTGAVYASLAGEVMQALILAVTFQRLAMPRK